MKATLAKLALCGSLMAGFGYSCSLNAHSAESGARGAVAPGRPVLKNHETPRLHPRGPVPILRRLLHAEGR
jgi:hypothetical protein